jgi:hypothetical protein
MPRNVSGQPVTGKPAARDQAWLRSSGSQSQHSTADATSIALRAGWPVDHQGKEAEGVEASLLGRAKGVLQKSLTRCRSIMQA